MNRIKVYLPLDHIPQSCKECLGLRNTSLDHIPVYVCIPGSRTFSIADYDQLGSQRPGWCPVIIVEESKKEKGHGEVEGMPSRSEGDRKEGGDCKRRLRKYAQIAQQMLCGKEDV